MNFHEIKNLLLFRNKQDVDFFNKCNISNSDLFLVDKSGLTLIDFAITCGDLDLIDFLLKSGFDLNDVDVKNRNVIMRCLLSNISEEFILNLINLGVDLHLKDWTGNNLFNYVLLKNNFTSKLLEILIEKKVYFNVVDNSWFIWLLQNYNNDLNKKLFGLLLKNGYLNKNNFDWLVSKIKDLKLEFLLKDIESIKNQSENVIESVDVNNVVVGKAEVISKVKKIKEMLIRFAKCFNIFRQK